MDTGRYIAMAGKSLRLLRRRAFVSAAVRQRTAAAVEHLEPILLVRPATLIDVGANKGQFSLAVHALFPRADIIAFEPLPESADRYANLFSGRRDVALHRMALSDTAGQLDFHVTDRADSSSLLKPGAQQATAFGVGNKAVIKVAVDRLDAVIDPAALASPILLKIDVQGAELQVLRGCDTLESIDFVYAELSFVELYETQALFEEINTYLVERGFALVGVFNQVSTAAFGPTQADFLFRNMAKC